MKLLVRMINQSTFQKHRSIRLPSSWRMVDAPVLHSNFLHKCEHSLKQLRGHITFIEQPLAFPAALQQTAENLMTPEGGYTFLSSRPMLRMKHRVDKLLEL